MTNRKIMQSARAALADTRTPADVAVDGAAEKLGAALGKAATAPMSEVLSSIAHDLDVCASSDTIDVPEVCASLAMELRERAKLEAAKEAAAPDLLAALRSMVATFDTYNPTKREAAVYDAARAAIARAEGGAA